MAGLDLDMDERGSVIAAANDMWSEHNDHVVEDGERKPVEIAKKETRAVGWLRVCVVVVLVCSAAAVALMTHHYISKSESDQFKSQFEDDAKKIFGAIGSSIDKTLSVYDNIAVSLVSHARYANQTWPYVVMPNFALRVAKLLPPSAAITVNVMPIVTPENRARYEAFTAANDYWVNEGMAVQETWEGFYGPVVYNGTFDNGIIHGDFDVIPANIRYETSNDVRHRVVLSTLFMQFSLLRFT
jgi:hypothetical protein